jgi:hypothetical protein
MQLWNKNMSTLPLKIYLLVQGQSLHVVEKIGALQTRIIRVTKVSLKVITT